MQRAFYAETIARFLDASVEEVMGTLSMRSGSADEPSQKDAWTAEIDILRRVLLPHRDRGWIFLEFVIPRLYKRIDALVLLGGVVVVIEFKIGKKRFEQDDIEQVHDYALDLKNFHETSHGLPIVPVLVPSAATEPHYRGLGEPAEDGVFAPVRARPEDLPALLGDAARLVTPAGFRADLWVAGTYRPTPTIIDAARALFGQHRVEDIARTDADAANLHRTTQRLEEIVDEARAGGHKAICLVTGVPGAGKTLVGLNIAAKHHQPGDDLRSVFLSGNGPLVKILRKALVRDRVRRAREQRQRVSNKQAEREVKSLVQNVHQFRDDCLERDTIPPVERVAIFDEAQRAWNRDMTARFMHRKRHRAHFEFSEPEYLVSCLDRHRGWAVIVCLVGGGQEINRGEAGIAEWLEALERRFGHWRLFISPRLHDSEYAAGRAVEIAARLPGARFDEALHLSVSMRSFRAENLAQFVKQLLDGEVAQARQTLRQLRDKYPIVLTRSLEQAKQWIRRKARGSERFGLLASSGAKRLKPLGVFLRRANDLDNDVYWFLNDRHDVRSSYSLEDAATEFNVQGLELDWTIVAWDADMRRSPGGWTFHQFRGTKWETIGDEQRQRYLLNAYRVLLTRSRQGMVIVVPKGDASDPTRPPEFYDGVFAYLLGLGIELLPTTRDVEAEVASSGATATKEPGDACPGVA